MVDGNQKIQIPDDIFEDSAPLWEDFLIGKFISTSAPHVAKIHVIVNKIWSLGAKKLKIDVFEVNKTTVKFRIKKREIHDMIIWRGMWSIADVLMVSKWFPITEEMQPDVKSIMMWIIIKHVPHRMFTWKGVRFHSECCGRSKAFTSWYSDM